MPWYLRALEVSRPLHFGDYGGTPLKFIWAMFDIATIAVLASGFYLWVTKGRRRRLALSDPPRSGHSIPWRRFLTRSPGKIFAYSVGRTYWQLVLLGSVIAAGLASALLGEGPWDWMSWLMLSIPLALVGHFCVKAR